MVWESDIVRKKNQLYEVEIKSQSILREGKKGLIVYFQGGSHKTIGMNIQKLYPQYTKPEDKPMFTIRPMTKREYNERVESGKIQQKAHLVESRAHVV
jgi:hypothetical protein